jgi:hypothetical protein
MKALSIEHQRHQLRNDLLLPVALFVSFNRKPDRLPVCLAPSVVKNCLADTSFHLPTTDDCALTIMKFKKPMNMQIIIGEAFSIKAVNINLFFIPLF